MASKLDGAYAAAAPEAAGLRPRALGYRPSAAVLDKAELMPPGIVHDHDNPPVIVVPLAGPAATETLDLPAARPDVVDLDIEVDADLCGLRLCHSLNVSRGRSSRREPTVAHPASSPCSPVIALF